MDIEKQLCSNCKNKELIIDYSKILLSYPPKFKGICLHCSDISYWCINKDENGRRVKC